MRTSRIIALSLIACASGVSEASSKVVSEKHFDDDLAKQSSETVIVQDVSPHAPTSHDRSTIVDIAKMDSQKSVASVMAAAMARRLVHNDLLMVGSRIAKRRTRHFLHEGEQFQEGGTWITLIVLLLLVVAVLLLLYVVARPPGAAGGYDYDGNKNMVVSGRPVGDKPVENVSADPFLGRAQYGQQRFSPPPAQKLLSGSGSLGGSVSQQQPFSSQQQPFSSQQQIPSPSQPPTEQTSSPLQTTLNVLGLGGGSSLLSPQSASRAAWSTVPGVPPPLRPQQMPPQTPKSYRVAVGSLRKLYSRAPIEITSEFDYPQFYARLGYGAEGSRLEITAEPSWRNLIATIGRLDYPARLSPDAMLHGPDREFYGPFQRYAGGFSVGHWSKGGTQILTLTPRQNWTGGFYVEVKAGSTDVASVQSIDNGSRYQIDIQPGIDNVLIITSVLAAFVASQPMIDDAGTRV